MDCQIQLSPHAATLPTEAVKAAPPVPAPEFEQNNLSS